MKDRINTYFSILLITLAGAVAAWLIVHISDGNVTVIDAGSEASYSALKESILETD
ncbi:hypothetical protein HYT04_02695 [Candidatus Kaiserbacteria bacterium]|nr:hypothetical protein [Candidatus Kaiserbacteria bacterium]